MDFSNLKYEEELINSATKYKDELIKARVLCDDGIVRINTRLLSKEASKHFLMENSIKCAEHDKNFVPDDLEEFADKILSMDNVYVSLLPTTNYFNKSGKFIERINVISERGRLDFKYDDIINRMNYRMDFGAVIYFYVYYGIITDIVTDYKFGGEPTLDRDVKTYWWRMAYKQDNISKHTDDKTLTWEERYKKFEQHHIEETTFLVKKIHEIRNGYEKNNR